MPKKPGLVRDLCIAAFGIALGVILMTVWIPDDTETGIIDVWRRSVRIGDALFPTIAAIGLAASGIWIGAESLVRRRLEKQVSFSPAFFVVLVLVHTVSLLLMFWTGALAVDAFGPAGSTYRLLLDTPPWKFVGFLTGGTFLIFSLISLFERKISLRGFVTALAATVFIAAAYDLPFDSIPLPPNGDF